MNFRVFRLFVAVLTIPFLFLLALPAAHAGDSGVEGTIAVSPSRPGPQRKDEPAEAPVANTAFVVKKGAEKVASFTTDSKGYFHLTLPPGHYRVSRQESPGAIGHWDFEVEVTADKMAVVHWTADSGMR